MQKFSLNDGPGIRTVVFFKGCPLRCRWCSNPESQNPEFEELFLNEKCEYRTVEEIISYCLKDRDFYEESSGGVTLSGGEVLMQHDFALSLLRSLKEASIDTCIETTGFSSPEVFSSLFPYLDHILFDVKHYDNNAHTAGTGVSNRPILSNLSLAVSAGMDILPRIPVIRGFNDSPKDAAGFCTALKSAGVSRVQLLPFHQFGEKKYELLGREYALKNMNAYHEDELEDYRKIFIDEGIEAFF